MSERHISREYQIARRHITPKEIEAISIVASLRRQEAQFLAEVTQVQPEVAEWLLLLVSPEHVPDFVSKTETPQERQTTIDRLQMLARGEMQTDPAMACFRLAAVARLLQAEQRDATVYIEQARVLTNTLGESVFDLNGRALLISAERIANKHVVLPDVSKVAEEVKGGHAGVLREYALALPPEKREEFLSHFPQKKGESGLSRGEVSAILDRLLSDIYKHGVTDGQQMNEMRERVGQTARDIVNTPTESDTRRMIQLLSHTIAQIPGEESKYLLRELGDLSRAKVRGDKDATKVRVQMGVRIAREAFAADQKNGSIVMKKMLGLPELSQSVWTEFVQALISAGELSRHLSRFLPKDEAIVRRLFAEFPNEVNTIADTLSDKRFADFDMTRDGDAVFDALHNLSSVTPIIFDRYRRSDEKERKELVRKLKELKPAFFRNDPIVDILPREDREILAEMVYVSYRPVGMSFEQVQKFLKTVKDHTEDIDQYEFPRDGYELLLGGAKEYRLRDGVHLNQKTVRSVQQLFVDVPKQVYADRYKAERAKSATEVTDALDQKDIEPSTAYVYAVRDMLLRFAKGGTDCTDEELNIVLSLLHGDDMVQRFRSTHSRVSETNGHAFFTEAKELLGLYFRDNYPKRLENFLSAQPKVVEKLIKELQKADRQTVLRRKMGDAVNDADFAITDSASVAQLLSKYIEAKVLLKTRTAVEQGANAFVPASGGSGGGVGDVRAYVSKNAASFFAKAAAGICTSEDVSLFERKDHFHINIVEDGARVLGNIQAYVVPEKDGKKSLVLRGFNPTTEALKRIDAGEFVEEVLRMAREFVQTNNFFSLVITEGLGGWHALSNREQVNKYIQPKYCKGERARSLHLVITGGGQTVNTVYQIPQVRDRKIVTGGK